MGAVQTQTTYPGLDFEQIWARLQETDRKLQDVAQIVRENAEQQRETNRQIKELRDEINRIAQEVERISKKRAEYTTETYPQIEENLDDEEAGWVEEINRKLYEEISDDFGNLAEYLVRPFIERKFIKLGFNWTRSQINRSVTDPENSNNHAYIDILLENDKTVIAIDIKKNVDEGDVDEHIERMEILRRDADKRQDKRKYRGAIAAVEMNEKVREYMLQNGLYLLKQSGKTINFNIPDNFVPREW